jgi:hypothetical protein
MCFSISACKVDVSLDFGTDPPRPEAGSTKTRSRYPVAFQDFFGDVHTCSSAHQLNVVHSQGQFTPQGGSFADFDTRDTILLSMTH